MIGGRDQRDHQWAAGERDRRSRGRQARDRRDASGHLGCRRVLPPSTGASSGTVGKGSSSRRTPAREARVPHGRPPASILQATTPRAQPRGNATPPVAVAPCVSGSPGGTHSDASAPSAQSKTPGDTHATLFSADGLGDHGFISSQRGHVGRSRPSAHLRHGGPSNTSEDGTH
jgi:hypothetical protein